KKTSPSSQTIKSGATIGEEGDENGANSLLLAKASFEWRFGKRALRDANVSSPPYTSPEATYN
ncbi:hypothetical protein H0E87_024923, partial [Populus deltoides]